MSKTFLQTLLGNRGLRLADLARKINVNKGTVTRWSKDGVPLERVSEVSRATGIPPCDIRPDKAEILKQEAV
jgi:transcriptional regulator with XRE-family HTH domain